MTALEESQGFATPHHHQLPALRGQGWKSGALLLPLKESSPVRLGTTVCCSYDMLKQIFTVVKRVGPHKRIPRGLRRLGLAIEYMLRGPPGWEATVTL